MSRPFRAYGLPLGRPSRRAAAIPTRTPPTDHRAIVEPTPTTRRRRSLQGPAEPGARLSRDMAEAAAATPSTLATSVAGAWSHRSVRHVAALVLYLTVTCIILAPLLGHPDSRVLYGFGDATQAIRNYDV